jgi:hypothetical protein
MKYRAGLLRFCSFLGSRTILRWSLAFATRRVLNGKHLSIRISD